MPKTNWQDINDPGRFVKAVKEEEKSAVTDEATEKKKDEPEVRLKNPRIEAGGGLQYNKNCTLTVDVEYLKVTNRKRVLFDLFTAYNGTDEKIESGKEGFEKDGKASVDVKLYYHSKHPGDQTPSDYYFVAKHLKGEAEVKSDKVSVPSESTIKVDFVEIADVHFHHNCGLPALDEKGDLIAALASAFAHAKENAGRELVVEGHADRSGDAGYNLKLSKRRAESIKALLDNDGALWTGVVDSDGTEQKIEAEDYQQTLKSLSVNYGWPCDPGAVDNKPGPKTETGVKNFQTEYNKRFPGNEQLTVDGKVGPKTWQAVFHVLRDLLSKALKSTKLDPPPALTYGYPDGKGVYPCGESSPLSGDEKSKEDRRVELVFYKKGDASPAIAPAAARKVDKKKDPVTEKTWEKAPVKSVTIKPDPILTIVSTDTHFAPRTENIDIKFTIKNCSDVEVKLVVESDHYPKKTVYERPLTNEEKADGADKALQWDGKTSCTDGDLKDTYINPLFSPYKAKLSVTGGAESAVKEFDVLYAEIKLEKSTWIGDGSIPDDATKKDWYRYYLNRLGYFGGPFTNDASETALQRTYLEKAIRFYKYYNESFVKKTIEDNPAAESYRDLLDGTTNQYGDKLQAQIKLGNSSRMNKYFQPTDDVFNGGGSARFVIPSWYYEKSAQFNAAGENRYDIDDTKLNDPFIPIKATILIKKKDNKAVDDPDAVGKVKVAWRVVDPPESDLAARYAATGKADDVARKPYMENLQKWLQENETYSDGTTFTKNCPERCGGKRDLEKIFLSLRPFAISKPDKLPCSEASIDGSNNKVFGRSGVNFVPSKIAGDSYKVIADLDFTGLPNADHLKKKHNADDKTGRDACKKETGVFTIWRDDSFVRIVKWSYKEDEAVTTYDCTTRITDAVLTRIRQNYEHAYIDFAIPKTTDVVDITDVITNDEYLEIIKAFKPANMKAQLTAAGMTSSQADSVVDDAKSGKEWLFKDKFKLVKEHLYGRDVPPQKKVSGDVYRKALRALFYSGNDCFVRAVRTPAAIKIAEKLRKTLPTGHIIAFFKPHAPVDIKKAPPGDNSIKYSDFIGTYVSCGLADGVVVYDLGDTDKLDYVASHEMGHHNFLYHHRTSSDNESVDNPKHHDLDDNNCIMSYSSGAGTNPPRNKGHDYDPFFCAKCNLRLRGWKVEKLGKMENKAGAHGKVKPEKVICQENVPVAIEAVPDAGYKLKTWKKTSGAATFGDAAKDKTTVTVTTAPAGIEAEFETV